jgi:lysine biosynthesis protein LysW
MWVQKTQTKPVHFLPMQALIVTCPDCAEELEILESDWQEFQLGDILGCNACGAELEVVSLEPPEFEPLVYSTECPKCGSFFALSKSSSESASVTCPDCQFSFALEDA